MNDYKYYLDNGIFDIQNGKFEQAIENINKSLELKKDWEIPYFYRAVANQALENFDEAMLDYYNRARISLSRKDIQNPDIEKAVSDLEKALELDENFVDALFAMAAAQKKLENYHKALEYLEILLQIEPEAVQSFEKINSAKIYCLNVLKTFAVSKPAGLNRYFKAADMMKILR